jgi:hypothetical protein
MKMNSKAFQQLLDEESDEFDALLEKQKVSEKINKLLVKEKHADLGVYKSHDSKRKFKVR